MEIETIKNTDADIYHEALVRVGNPRSTIEARHIAILRNFHNELRADKESAERAAATLDTFNRGVLRFVAEVEQANIGDTQIATWLHKLRSVANVPSQLRAALRDLQQLNWKSVAQSPYPDELDHHKRDALIRDFRRRLTRFGDIE